MLAAKYDSPEAAVPFPPTSQPAGGVSIGRDVTFARDVAPIVFQRCATCHRPGEAAPFSLLKYEDVRRRAQQILDVTQSRFMPPWLPAEGQGEFIGERRLSDGELQTLKDWVESNMPRGDDADMPPVPTFIEGWQLGTPDLVLESPAYELKGDDRDVFRNFVVPITLDGPRWIESIELRPENPRVTHHARLGIDSTNESIRRDAEDPGPGYAGMAWAQDPDGQLVIWAPGMVASRGVAGVAWRIFPGSCLVLHTHMQPSGKTEQVKVRIGIHFAKEPPTEHPVMMRIGSGDIDIPAGEANHVVTDSYTLPVDVRVQTIFPHAHSLCKSLSVDAQRPDGTRQPLIAINKFDENWHDAYRYREPILLPKGTQLFSRFSYDNTDANVRNRRHPPMRVVYGSNVTDEMGDVYLQVVAIKPDQRAALMEDYKQYELRSQLVGYRKSLELLPDDLLNQESLATCLVGLGDPRGAAEVLRRRLEAGPKAVYPIVSLGMSLLASGDAAGAEVQLRLGISLDAQYPLAWFGLGRALMQQKRFDDAEKAFRNAVELAPGLVDSRLGLADLLIRKGNLDEATTLCTAAVRDAPDNAPLFLKLAEISARQEKFDESLDYFASARRAAPYTHPPKVLLAIFCFSNNQADRGLQLLNEARAESPDNPMPSLLLGQIAMMQNQFEPARTHFADALAQSIPDNWPQSHRQRFQVLLHSNRFRLGQQTGDQVLAREALGQWLQCDPTSREARSLAAQLGVPVP